jgi:N-acyl-D-aspartate/D-glutamate deacylase
MTPAYVADIGILDGKIAEIGQLDEAADNIFDASGKLVTPGFLDIHTHFDAQVFWDPKLTPSCLFGITTAMITNCGFALAPVKPEDREWALRFLSRVEGMPYETLSALPFDWESYPEYLDVVDKQPLGINIGAMVPHSVMRYYVMGDAARHREATTEEIEALKDEFRANLEVGGFGLSSSSNPAHKDGDGMPIPSQLASREEFLELCKVQKEYPNTNIEYTPEGLGAGLTREQFTMLGDMSRAAGGKPINWNAMLELHNAPGAYRDYLKWVDEENELGARVFSIGAVSEMDADIVLAGAGNMFDDYPHWTKALSGDMQNRTRLLSDASNRANLKNDFASIKGTFPGDQWHRIEVSRVNTPENEKYLGKFVGEIAEEEGKDPLDVFLDISVSEDLQTGFYFHGYLNFNVDAIDEYMSNKHVLPGISDAGAHLDYLCSYGWPIQFLAKNVKERNRNSIEEAVYRMTSLPFGLVGITDRGYIARGAAADLVIMDFEKLSVTPSRPARDLPGNQVRRIHEPTGIEAVFVNGIETIRDGKHTGTVAGKLLRSYDYR